MGGLRVQIGPFPTTNVLKVEGYPSIEIPFIRSEAGPPAKEYGGISARTDRTPFVGNRWEVSSITTALFVRYAASYVYVIRDKAIQEVYETQVAANLVKLEARVPQLEAAKVKREAGIPKLEAAVTHALEARENARLAAEETPAAPLVPKREANARAEAAFAELENARAILEGGHAEVEAAKSAIEDAKGEVEAAKFTREQRKRERELAQKEASLAGLEASKGAINLTLNIADSSGRSTYAKLPTENAHFQGTPTYSVGPNAITANVIVIIPVVTTVDLFNPITINASEQLTGTISYSTTFSGGEEYGGGAFFFVAVPELWANYTNEKVE